MAAPERLLDAVWLAANRTPANAPKPEAVGELQALASALADVGAECPSDLSSMTRDDLVCVCVLLSPGGRHSTLTCSCHSAVTGRSEDEPRDNWCDAVRPDCCNR